jgi:hypothetical protein
MEKMALSFYCDDTNPYGRPADTFGRFLDFVRSEGVAGESSFIPGYRFNDVGFTTRDVDAAKETFIQQVIDSYEAGLDTHFELMTHAGVFDFANGQLPAHPHEGVWMEDPSRTFDDYYDYFAHIIDEAARVGVQFTGMTTPGCVCEVCAAKKEEYAAAGFYQKLNPAVWEALAQLAAEGRFRRKVVPCFAQGEKPEARAVRVASRGDGAVYDLVPNAGDMLGSWRLSTDYVSTDYYITADGEGGRIVELLRAGAPYCLFYCHWQGFNPHDGLGWDAFVEMVRRVNKLFGDRIEWKRPSDIAAEHEQSGTYLTVDQVTEG